MEDFRSKSCGDGRMQMESYHGGGGAGGVQPQVTQMELSQDLKFNKVKSTNGSSSQGWSFSDPEFQRKKRVASYNVYAVEGKVKGSFRKSFMWLRDRYTQVVYGWR